MSNYGHFTQQYYGNRIPFPEESFKIVGISHYQECARSVTYDSELQMLHDPSNIKDNSAIAIYHNDKLLGYVPKSYQILCNNYINEPLKVINMKAEAGIIGIRVIPKQLHIPCPALESKILFCD